MKAIKAVLVNTFKKVNASINWSAICGSLFFAMLTVLLFVFAVVMFSINPKTVILSSLIVGLLGSCFAIIIADNKHFTVVLRSKCLQSVAQLDIIVTLGSDELTKIL